MSGAYAIVANVDAADSALRLGARVVVHNIPGNPEHIFVRGLSRGGRVIMKWTSRARLTNFRSAWIHRAPPLWFASREEAEKVIAQRLTPSLETPDRTSDSASEAPETDREPR